MNSVEAELLTAFELHSPDRIRAVLDDGFDVGSTINGQRAINAVIELGADVDARADQDSVGFGGQTPLFHTVNSSENRSEPVMRLLLEAGARADILLAGITWGKDMEWETECFDITPVSYAQLGLLKQFQRSEQDIYSNIRVLLKVLGREIPQLRNMPNRYLQK